MDAERWLARPIAQQQAVGGLITPLGCLTYITGKVVVRFGVGVGVGVINISNHDIYVYMNTWLIHRGSRSRLNNFLVYIHIATCVMEDRILIYLSGSKFVVTRVNLIHLTCNHRYA